MYQICHLIMENQFGGYPLTEHDMDRIRRFYRHLENNIKSLLGFYPYMFRQRVSAKLSLHNQMAYLIH